MVWLEVETKVKLENKQVPALRKKIKEIAVFEKKGTKSDDYFAIQKKGFPKKAFRFRSMGDKIEITFKKHLKKLWTKEVVVKQEFEFNLEGKENMFDLMALLKDFGFKEWVKKRNLQA
jgi:predicted adenylyl cyclase CyaB